MIGRTKPNVATWKPNPQHASWCMGNVPYTRWPAVGDTAMARKGCSCSRNPLARSLRKLEEVGVMADRGHMTDELVGTETESDLDEDTDGDVFVGGQPMEMARREMETPKRFKLGDRVRVRDAEETWVGNVVGIPEPNPRGTGWYFVRTDGGKRFRTVATRMEHDAEDCTSRDARARDGGGDSHETEPGTPVES